MHGTTVRHTYRRHRTTALAYAGTVVAAIAVTFTAPLSLAEERREPTGPAWRRHTIDASSQGADGVKLADINGDGLMDIATGWEEGGITRVYLHPGHAKAKTNWPAVTVGKTPSVEDAVFADLDGDGALDVVSCSEENERKIFVHWGPKTRRDLLNSSKWQQQVLADSQMWMFAWPMQVDNKHGVDLIAGSKGPGASIAWFAAPKNGRDLESYQQHTISPAGWIMSIWQQDMDGDSDIDIVVSDRYGELRGCRWLENPGPGPAQSKSWKNHFIGARDKEVLSMVLADLDDDGLQDAVVAVRDMKILLLKRLDKTGRNWKTEEISADYHTGNTRAVAVEDVNGDGRKDLVFTTWNAQGKHGVLWLEQGSSLKQWTARQISGTEQGVKYDRIEMLDLDGDGDLDLLTCEEHEGRGGLGVIWYENPYRR